jgi:hypothetical protein
MRFWWWKKVTQADAIIVRMAESFGQSPAQVRDWPVSDVMMVLSVWRERAEETKKEQEFDDMKAMTMFGGQP